MSPLDAVAVVGLVLYALVKQTRTSPVHGAARFKLAAIYAVVGLILGGVDLPSGVPGWALAVGSLLLSAVVGIVRGRLTRIWVGHDGVLYQRGTAVTVGLFLGLIAVKVGAGFAAEINHIDDGESFGTVMVMMAMVVATQAEIVWRRASSLRTAPPVSTLA